MADLFADSLMLAINIFMVRALLYCLYGLYLVVKFVITEIVLERKTDRMKKEKEVDSDDL